MYELPMNTRVLTTEGFIKVSEINTTHKLLDKFGNISSISKLQSTEQPLYNLTFQGDNEVQVFDTTKFFMSKAGAGMKGSSIISTEDMCNYHDKQPLKVRPRWVLIDLPVNYKRFAIAESSELTIDPYTLGFLLGDGCFRTKGATTPYTTVDTFITEKLKDKGYTITDWNDSKGNITHNIKYIHKEIIQLGLKGTDSGTKFIPELDYTLSDKVNLIQGLMDADGCVNKDSSLELTLKSENMIDWVKGTVEYLGGTATKRVKIGKCKAYNFVGEYWRLYIRFPEASILFSLPRKVSRTKSKPLRNRLLSYNKDGVSKGVKIFTTSDSIMLDNHIVINKDKF